MMAASSLRYGLASVRKINPIAEGQICVLVTSLDRHLVEPRWCRVIPLGNLVVEFTSMSMHVERYLSGMQGLGVEVSCPLALQMSGSSFSTFHAGSPPQANVRPRVSSSARPTGICPPTPIFHDRQMPEPQNSINFTMRLRNAKSLDE
jgi:hypothetical protein